MPKVRPQALQLLAPPLAAIVILALSLFVINGTQAGYSALLGGATWILPNLYFTHKVFIIRPAKELIAAFYRAEVIKLLLSGLLFVLVIKYLPVTALLVLLAYLLAQIVFWLTILFYLGLKVR